MRIIFWLWKCGYDIIFPTCYEGFTNKVTKGTFIQTIITLDIKLYMKYKAFL